MGSPDFLPLGLVSSYEQAIPPLAPWRLRGEFLCALSLIEIQSVRHLLPSGTRPLPVLPGKTFGGIVLADYSPDSTLTYHELIAFPAIVWHQGRVGAWIEWISVDNLRSLKGGRELFGLPKTWLDFNWQKGQSSEIRVYNEGEPVLTVAYKPSFGGLRSPVWAPAFGQVGSAITWFQGSGSALLSPVRGELNVPTESPLAGWGFERPVILFNGHNINLKVGAIHPT